MTVMTQVGHHSPAPVSSAELNARRSPKFQSENAAAADKAAAPFVVSAPASRLHVVMFHVAADAEASVLPRLVEPFAKLGLVPIRVHLSTEHGAGDEISADLRVAGVDETTAHLLEKALSRIVGVRSVMRIAH